MALDKISIVIPTFNRNKELKRAINSVLNQKYVTNYEIIVLHNGPSLETQNLVKSFSSVNIHYYENQTNVGMTNNWNKAIRLANEDWIIMLHDDDELCPSYFEWLNFIMKKHKFDILIPPNNFDEIGKKTYKIIDIKGYQLSFMNIIGPPVGMVFKKESLKSLFKEEYYPSIDYKFYSEVCSYLRVLKVKGVPQVKYNLGVNESMKPETILKFLNRDRVIKRENEKYCSWWAKILSRRFLPYYEQYYIRQMQKKFNIEYDSRFDKWTETKVSFFGNFLFQAIQIVLRVTVLFNSKKIEYESKFYQPKN